MILAHGVEALNACSKALLFGAHSVNIASVEAACLRELLNGSNGLRDLLQLLHRCLVALQRLLDHLNGFAVVLAKLLQLGRILLLLLKQLLIILGSLLSLCHKLLHDLLAFSDLCGCVGVQRVVPP